MRILALTGSPRREGNTNILVDEILRGAEAVGHETEKINLCGCEISPCVDCRKCKTGNLTCPIKDGMLPIYLKINGADMLIIGSPNYFYGISAQVKLFIDRMRPYVESHKLNGKRAAIVISAQEGPSACGPLIETMRMTFDRLDIGFAGEVLAKAHIEGEIKKDSETMQNAYAFGASQ